MELHVYHVLAVLTLPKVILPQLSVQLVRLVLTLTQRDQKVARVVVTIQQRNLLVQLVSMSACVRLEHVYLGRVVKLVPRVTYRAMFRVLTAQLALLVQLHRSHSPRVAKVVLREKPSLAQGQQLSANLVVHVMRFRTRQTSKSATS